MPEGRVRELQRSEERDLSGHSADNPLFMRRRILLKERLLAGMMLRLKTVLTEAHCKDI